MRDHRFPFPPARYFRDLEKRGTETMEELVVSNVKTFLNSKFASLRIRVSRRGRGPILVSRIFGRQVR